MRKRIGLREVRALGPGDMIWDSTVAGFCARRQKSAAVTYYVKYRTVDGRQRWQVIGRHGSPWTPEEARGRARRIVGLAKDGADPAAERRAARTALTVAQLCDSYLADAEAGRILTRSKQPKKASTLTIDKGRIARHIKPLLGGLAVTAVTHDDVERFLHDVADGRTAGNTKTGRRRGLARVTGGQTAATRAVGLLGAIFTYAVRRRMRADNPVRGVTRFADNRRQRRLSDGEYKTLGEALRKAGHEYIWPAAVAAARFLTLTGWRSGEALGLRWKEVDLSRRTVVLSDTKTGQSIRPLSKAACAVLRDLTHGAEVDLVFPATRGSGRMTGFPKLWARIAKLSELPPSVTPHVLRHSFSSLASDLGYSEPTIAALVGHKGRSVTSRYVHAADAVLLAAADAVADRTVTLMGGSRPGAVIESANGRFGAPRDEM